MIGRTFGRLVVVAALPGRPRPTYACVCVCGNRSEARGDQLRSKRKQSCGCYQRDRAEAAQYRRWDRVKAARRQAENATN